MMIKNNLKKKIISALALGAVVTSLGMTAFASDLNQEPTTGKANSQGQSNMGSKGNGGNREKRQGKGSGECLEQAGIFDAEKIEEIKTYLDSKREERQEDRGSFRDKTEEERKAHFEAKENERQEAMNGLVTEGIITQEQLDTLKETMPQKKAMQQRRGQNRK